MASSTGNNLNELITQREALLNLAGRPDLEDLLRSFAYTWDANTFDEASYVAGILQREGMIDTDGLHLNRAGRLFIARLLIHFGDGEAEYGTLAERYANFHVLSAGKKLSCY